MNHPVLFYVLVFLMVWACRSAEEGEENETNGGHTLHEKPLREPYAGMNWEKISGAGMEFWAQQSPDLGVGISETLPGAFVERMENGKPVALQRVLQVFSLPNKKIEDLLDILAADEGWSKSEGCSFEAIDSNREGVDRVRAKTFRRSKTRIREAGRCGAHYPYLCRLGNGQQWHSLFRVTPDESGQGLVCGNWAGSSFV
ncbi:hypothetical protein [Cyclobacterium xiamenense]|uniref:hypothetical protein n=1 Tax=Cyclobacterium xiamenense TaxID=1297121 RepID=UPI0035CF8206